MKPALIVCDFDGTIAAKDVLDTIYAHFGTRHAAGQPYDANSHGAMTRAMAQRLDVSQAEFNQFVDAIPLRDGFAEFFAECRALNIPLVVVSSGWDAYIVRKLAAFAPELMHHFPDAAPRTDILPIYSNALTYRAGVHRWDQAMAWPDTDTNSYPDKSAIINTYRRYVYGDIWMIGDGSSDTSAAVAADRVFARDALAHQLQVSGRPYTAYESFSTITWELKKVCHAAA